ncbi:GTP-binding protein [Zostera marina]|uniref:GTP-binding protein n=1 Tax=Zostera marina TaxID=29655 RepID=A0A0K9P9T1_ZOSMR|nr:GTP-binding protein [Zostera marina]
MLLTGRLCLLRLHSPIPCPFLPFLYSRRIFLHTIPAAKSQLKPSATETKISQPSSSQFESIRPSLFVPPGLERDDVTVDMVLPWSNIVVGPYAGDAQVNQVEFIKSSVKMKDCPRDQFPEFAVIGRSNVGKSSLINRLVKRKEIALTSKNPGKTQLINHFLINKSWYIVDLPGYGFATASKSARMDWFSFTKGFFLNRDTLVGVLLLIDATVPLQKIDLDCANWLGRNNIGMTLVFTKCDKIKGGKGTRPDANIRAFQDLLKQFYKEPLPWIMTSSLTGLSRDDLLLHMSQLRNYWDI